MTGDAAAALLFAAATALFAEGEPRLRVDFVPETARVGDKVALTIAVEGASEGAAIEWPLVGTKLGDLDVVSTEGAPLSRTYRLRSFVPGDHLVEKLSVALAPEAGGEKLVLETEEKILTLDGLVEEGTTKPRGAKGIVPVPAPFRWELAFIPAVVLLLGGLALFVARRRFRGDEIAAPPAPPPEPADIIALRALDALEREGLVGRGRVPEHFYRLSGIVRRYIEARFGIAAAEMTSEEFLEATARSEVLPKGHRETLREFMRVSDLAKYARFVPGQDEVAATLAAARRFVRETSCGAGALPEREALAAAG